MRFGFFFHWICETIVLLNTMQHAPDVDDEGKRKPIMVKYYIKKQKRSVYFCQYVSTFHTVKENKRRWPMVLVYNLLDSAAVASHIIYKEVFSSNRQAHKERGQ